MTPLVLIVDDEQSIQDLLKIYFGREGFVVACASSIREAEQALGRNKFDLVLIDIYLGEGTGIDLLRHVRAFNPHIQVVLMTGLPDVQTAAEALRLGAFDYVTKPIAPHQIVGIAQRAMLGKKLVEENERRQANLDAIFHSASDGIILVDSSNTPVRVNGAAMQSCGFILDTTGFPQRPEESGCGGTCRQTMARVLQNGSKQTIRRFECRKNDGTRRTISLSASPVFESNGSISGAVGIMRDETELVYLEKQVYRQSGFGGLVGGNSAMQRMYTLIEALADVPTTVLVNGESGTGKELVAAALHHQGGRRDKPIVKVNCSALSEHLLESELFGHVRGAFTGAVSAKIGRFQRAHGGTIFLDEIGDISIATQMRLLRVLQEHEFEQVGDSTPVKVDVRVIAATNQDLAEKVRLGTFRHDLYYRLNVVRLIVPPLRDRLDDIPLLVDHFLEKFIQKFNKPLSGVSPETLELLTIHTWPGNVRELEHTLEHAAIVCRSSNIEVADLPQDFLAAIHDRTEEMACSIDEEELTLEDALKMSGGNKAKAARLLGVSRCTVYRKLQDGVAVN
ncbi:MAG: sigma-54-dependent Fis family transcriptional regulator [Geobacteraceae bacterium GWC2_53_11]|nr:MAG: sigma-54-dependent Fis family transcriptional regulator [Geobacteraceae bacterium GWC2_53_11]